jgi:hypothetical protein
MNESGDWWQIVAGKCGFAGAIGTGDHDAARFWAFSTHVLSLSINEVRGITCSPSLGVEVSEGESESRL